MAPGYLLAIFTGIFYGAQGFLGKLYGRKYNAPLLTWATFTFSAPFVAIWLFLNGIPNIDWYPFLWSTFTSFLVNVVAWNLFFKALSLSPLSLTMPFTSFTPLFLIPVAYLILHELPDTLGTTGILLIIAGAYGLHLDSKNLLAPFRSMFKEKGTRYMLIVALVWSVSATVEKVAVRSSSPEFYGLIINLSLSLAYTPYVLRNHVRKFRESTTIWRDLSILGLISALLILVQFTALKYLLVSYVIAFKRAGVIVSVLLGAILFKEKNVVKNLICTALMVWGAMLIM